MTKQISEGRQTAYYVGMAIMVVGGLMFFSTFIFFAMNFGDFSNFNENAKSSMFRAFGGMALLVVGGIVASIGRAGLAGSGVLLDPEQAKEDLEPYSRMVGGMAKDALDAADVHLGQPEAKPVVMVRCQACGKLNDEAANFCQQCGKKL